MADPDGVARGGVRFNVHGYDVNRNWDIADPKLMPEIAALRKAVLYWVDGGHPVALFLNLHNTNNDFFQGSLTKAGPEYRTMVERLNRLMSESTRLVLNKPLDLPAGEVARGRMDAPQGLFHDRGIWTLLLEMNVQKNRKLGRPFSIADWRDVGAHLPGAVAAAVSPER
jgi:hypothetical protein